MMSALTPAASPPIRARHAYPAVAAVYAAVFATAVTWTAMLLSAYHAFPLAWTNEILRHQQGADVIPAAFAWMAAMWIFGMVIEARRGQPGSRINSRRRHAAAIGALLVADLPALWAVLHVSLLESDDLTPRIVELLGGAVLAAALAARLGAPSLGKLGIAQGSRGGYIEFYGAMRISLLGLCGSFGAACLIFYMLRPPALVGPVGAASGVSEAWWFWIAVVFVNAIVEEGICTAWLYALLHRAGRPRREIYAVAAAARVAFHLYMGLPGLSAGVFALVNIRLFERTRRLAPLVATHALFDSATITGNPAVLHVFIMAGAVMLLYPASYLPRARKAKDQQRSTERCIDAVTGSHSIQASSVSSTPTGPVLPDAFDGRIVLNTLSDAAPTTGSERDDGGRQPEVPHQRTASGNAHTRRPR